MIKVGDEIILSKVAMLSYGLMNYDRRFVVKSMRVNSIRIESLNGSVVIEGNFVPDRDFYIISKEETEECYVCSKEMGPDDSVYRESYFCQITCSWECMVKHMSEFFGVSKDSPAKLRDLI
ncbi:hypothetical protein [Peribacillus asahii]|uniref:hypothetical protein n=1 Tax=Peribacillus asahii TaxID=228899 RepID=UPI00382F1FB7